ncbi:MAG: UDP-N-acetylmuramate dehydrogenase [Atopobiaceae bacterium]|nr:UDP-N-acetylmuramate dehydrogenase [Atopobiaceae bacterium]
MSESGPERSSDLKSLIALITWICGEENVSLNEPLSKHTSFEVGGPAAVVVEPVTPEEVQETIAACKKADAPFFVMGNGSNLLVSDDGFDGVVICLAGSLDNATVQDYTLRCEAGVSLRDASEMACELGLSGLEFACGIPGTVGGAVFMNAGAYGGQIADCLESARILFPDGHVEDVATEDLAMGYRTSRVKTDDLVVLSATFQLEPGNPEYIRATMDDLTEQRESKQPLEYPSAGSTFKRPEGYFAGKLISDAGLAGYTIGGAQVSSKHCGFVINAGGATAADVIALIAHIQDEVRERFGVELEPEVRMLGF